VPSVIKIDQYNFELYHFKVGAFFLRHSVYASKSITFACVTSTHPKQQPKSKY